MDWFKKNYAQLALAVCALILLGTSAVLVLNARGFEDTFAAIRGEVRRNNTIPPLEITSLKAATAKLNEPATWMAKPGLGSLFVSEKYIVHESVLMNPLQGDKLLHPPVPNSWFGEHKLDILATDILQQDQDQDGFTNLEEWTGLNPGDPGKQPTNPRDKASRPPLITKLRLTRYISVPFRLLFNSYDGDPAKPDDMTFQIDTVDLKQRTQFVKLSQRIEGTKFKIVKFEAKKQTDPTTGVDQDISELTLQNVETNENVVLVLEKVVNSPDSFAEFKFLIDGTQFRVKKDQVFALKPEPERKYKLIDIKEAEALIEDLKTGDKIRIPRQ